MKFIKQSLLWAAACFCGAALAAGQPEANAMLWKISKNGATVGHLAGTMHIGRAADALPPAFQAALKDADELLVETTLNTDNKLENTMRDNPELAGYVAMLMMDKRGRPLAQSLGKARLDKVRRTLQRYSSKPVLLPDDAPLAPWMAYMMLSTGLKPRGYSHEHGTEEKLFAQAKKQNTPVSELEGLETLLVFDKLPENTLLRSMDLTLAAPQQYIADRGKLAAAYRRQDAKTLWNMAFRDPMQDKLPAADRKIWHDFLTKDLLENRNRAWLPKITAKLDKGRTMVAVGALHLFGDYGLIALLRQQGYTVEAVK